METPRYEFSKKKIKENYEDISRKLNRCKLFYAMKSNGNEKVIKEIKELGSGFECASLYEYDRVLKLGVDPLDIIFGLPIKTVETIEYTYSKGCRYYVFDDMRELEKLIKYAPEAKKILRVKVADIIPTSIVYGMSTEEIFSNCEMLKNSIDGISYHISYNNNIEDVRNVCSRVDEILMALKREDKKYIVNIGGGYEKSVKDDFYETYNELLVNLKEKYDCTFYAEPGKIIVHSAGCFYSKIISIKRYGERTVLYMDGGFANGIGHATFIGKIENCMNNDELDDVQKICEYRDCTCSNNTLIKDYSSKKVSVGDVIKFDELGAYSIVFQNDFHAWEKCKVEIV